MTNTNTTAPVAPAINVEAATAPVAPAINIEEAAATAPAAVADITETVDTTVSVEEIVPKATTEKKAKKVMVVPEMMQTDANLSYDALREVVSKHKNAGRVLYHSNNNASHANFNKGKSRKLQDVYLNAAAATIGYTVVTALIKNEDIGQVEEFLKTSNANAMIEMEKVCKNDENRAAIKKAEKARIKAEKEEAKTEKTDAEKADSAVSSPMIDIDALVAE